MVVRAGGTLVIGKGVKIKFANLGLKIDVFGTLSVRGTAKEPATITSEQVPGYFTIIAERDSEMNMRNAKIIGGGYSLHFAKNFSNTAIAANTQGAIQINGGNVDIQNTTFEDNDYAVIVSGTATVRVNRSRFIDNGFDVKDEINNSDFKYNWWGAPGEPQKVCEDDGSSEPYCYFEKMEGDFDFSHALEEEFFRDPVIIIPGILGSWEKDGAMRIDPIFHTYDNLYDEFVAEGYVPEKDLFTFPYEWRDSNVENAKKLKTKIAEITKTWPKVDLVAHSMGGLLAREYIESDAYTGDVDQLITLATPNLGTPEAYMKWDGDGWFFSPVDIFMKHIVTQEAKENGFADRFEYMHNRPVASLQELLPVYNYLHDADNGDALKNYPNNYPSNEFLENLNNKAGELTSVEYDKIIGNTNGGDTISGVSVANIDKGKYWTHGYPDNFDILIGNRGMYYSDGDVTVPLYSAESENIKSDYFREINSDHQSISTEAQADVLEFLTAERPASEVRNSLIRDMLITQVYSPVDIQLITSDGRWAGKNIDNLSDGKKISDAYYTGADAESEFVAIPNPPANGSYRVVTEGTGEGDFKVETTGIFADSDSEEASESVGIIEGVASVGKKEENIIKLNNKEIIASNKDNVTETSSNDEDGNSNKKHSSKNKTKKGNGGSEVASSMVSKWNVNNESGLVSRDNYLPIKNTSVLDNVKKKILQIENTFSVWLHKVLNNQACFFIFVP